MTDVEIAFYLGRAGSGSAIIAALMRVPGVLGTSFTEVGPGEVVFKAKVVSTVIQETLLDVIRQEIPCGLIWSLEISCESSPGVL